MKKMLLALIALFVLCGSTTFETVLNIEKGDSTREQIRSMLG